MNKQEFLTELQKRLSGLPKDDIAERAAFYEEIIEDHMEDGITEEEAVAEIGTVDSVVEQIMAETPLAKLVKEKVKPKRRLKTWEIILLAVGSCVWVPLLAAAIVIVLSLYIVIWTVVICVYAADLALAAGAVICWINIVTYFSSGNPAGAFFAAGAGLICAGCAILLFFANIWITKKIVKLSGKIMLGIKSLFIRKGDKK